MPFNSIDKRPKVKPARPIFEPQFLRRAIDVVLVVMPRVIRTEESCEYDG